MKRSDARSWIGPLFLVALVALLAAAPVPALADHRPGHPAGSTRTTTVPERQDSDEESGDGEEDSSERARTEGSDEDSEESEDRQEACGDDGSEEDGEGGCEQPAAQGQKPTTKDVPKANGTKTGSVGGTSVSGTAATAPTVREGAALTTAGSTGKAGGRARKGLIARRRGTSLHSVQPSLAIRVDALNDADEDGIFSDSEIAVAPGVDIKFKALITNTGSTQFEIVAVNQTFVGQGGRVQVDVCPDLGGVTVAPGDSVACSFSVSDYSPASGESAVSTVAASAIEFGGSGTRGASDSDNSTVSTLLGDEVLAAATQRVPGAFAFTGADAAWLLGLALVLLGTGGSLSYLARRQGRTTERRVLRIRPFRLPGLRSTQSPTSRPGEKAHRP